MTPRLKNSIKACAAVLSVLTFCSCSWGEDYWTDSYVEAYDEINGLRIHQFTLGSITFIGTGRSASIKSTGEDKVWFDRICHENGDFTYSREVCLMYGMPGINAYTPDIVSIDVLCEDDFDSSHPAGSSLNDYIKIKYRSVWSYIAAGYTGPDPYPDLRVKTRQLSEITPEDMRILLVGPELHFVTKPEKPGVHSLKIVMKMSDGKEYSDTFHYDFSKGQLTDLKWSSGR